MKNIRWRRQKLERLIKLLEVMLSVKKDKCKSFDWGIFGYKYREECKPRTMPDAPNFCGTVACVAGWAGLDPWFRRRGFRLDFIYDSIEIYTGVMKFGKEGGLSEFFGLSAVEENGLFYNSGDIDDAIKEIKRTIRNKRKEWAL